MASATGTDGIVKLVTDGGSLATVAEVRSFTIDETADTIESTSMGDSARTYLAGQKTATISLECFWDSSDAAQDDLDVTSKIDFEIYPNGVGTGKKYTGEGFVTDKSINVSFDGMVEATFAIQVTGAVTEASA
jgi:predicted secreted protein